MILFGCHIINEEWSGDMKTRNIADSVKQTRGSNFSTASGIWAREKNVIAML